MVISLRSPLHALRSSLVKPFGAEKRSAGMTLIEIIIVIAILGTLMTILLSTLTKQGDTAREDEARLGMGTIAQSLQMYRVHNNVYPTTAQGLNALLRDPGNAARWRGPYLEKEKLKDPWSNDYSYTSDGRKFEIVSGGLDGVIGGADDIYFPAREAAAGSGDKPAAP